MEIFLVGGAVRDQVLGIEPKERDWVVTGATVAELISLGYRQVGKNFPVFLHPKTSEEYALARRERKTAPGYYGFRCEFDPEVTLPEDLVRRDLTINAMAMDSQGKIIDPYGGKKDIEDKWLRHVSPAFIEDPVRVLRVARFAARFHKFGFKVAPETRRLMYQLICDGELDHLVPERIWQEWQASLSEQNPEQFILVLRSCGALKKISIELDRLFGIPDETGDAGVNMLKIFTNACKHIYEPNIRFAILLHDLGKLSTPPSEWPYHTNDAESSIWWIESLCERLRVPKDYKQLALLTAKYGKRMLQLKFLKANEVLEILEKTGAFRLGTIFDVWLVASNALNHTNEELIQCWKTLRAICLEIPTHELPKGSGEDIKNHIREMRIQKIMQQLIAWKHGI